LLIGITGAIASGKSTVSKFIVNMGYPVIDADEIGHEVLKLGGVKKSIVENLCVSLDPNGEINRKELAKVIFSNSQKLESLNRIMHPKMLKIILKRFRELSKFHSNVFVEAAVLFEMGLEKYVNYVIVTDCPDEIKIKRLMERNRVSFEEAKKRLSSQLSREDFLKKADFVIDTSNGIERTFERVSDMLKLKPWSGKM